jgi:rubrerythrin
MDPHPLRNDIWLCGMCKGVNVIKLSPSICPVCTHARDYQIGCCTNPGEYPPSTGLFPGHPGYQSPSGGEEPNTYHPSCSVPDTAHYGHGTVVEPFSAPEGFNDIWTCNECGSENLDWCTECPVCGADKDAALQCSMSQAITNLSEAGSAAEGVWICSACGCSNSAVHGNQCGACGVIN